MELQQTPDAQFIYIVNKTIPTNMSILAWDTHDLSDATIKYEVLAHFSDEEVK
jgi:hypothetical protein